MCAPGENQHNADSQPAHAEVCRTPRHDKTIKPLSEVLMNAPWRKNVALESKLPEAMATCFLGVVENPAQGPAPGLAYHIRDVWSTNFEQECDALLAVAARVGPNVTIALDTEFPGFVRKESQFSSAFAKYKALRDSVNLLSPIQIGLSVADGSGVVYGVWSFNLHFDLNVDLYTDASVAFLEAAGVDFFRHSSDGIELRAFSRWLTGTQLIGRRSCTPLWITFSGSYDLGYLWKLLLGKPLPRDQAAYERELCVLFPKRFELRDSLPYGSLDSLAQMYGLQRSGFAHTAGSDALATLDLFFRVVPKDVQHQQRSINLDFPSVSDEVLAAATSQWAAAAKKEADMASFTSTLRNLCLELLVLPVA